MTEILIQAQYLGKELARRLGCKGSIPAGKKIYASPKPPDRPQVDLASCSAVARSVRVKRSGVKTTILLQQVTKLRMHEALPYAFMVQFLIKHRHDARITGDTAYTHFLLFVSECLLTMKS